MIELGLDVDPVPLPFIRKRTRDLDVGARKRGRPRNLVKAQEMRFSMRVDEIDSFKRVCKVQGKRHTSVLRGLVRWYVKHKEAGRGATSSE